MFKKDESEKILIHSHMIFDYDLAIWKLLKDKKYGGDYINKNLINATDDEMKRFLMDRHNENPLYTLLDDRVSNEDKDSLYKEFLQTKQEELLENISLYDNIIIVMRRLQEYKFTDLTVIYTNRYEKQFLDKLVFNSVDISTVQYSEYDAICVKTTSNITENLNKYIGKNLYLAMARYNCNLVDGNFIFDKDFAKLVFKKININIIAQYVFNENNNTLG